MTRYRARAFGEPVAPWQATHELAAQSAIETDNAHREPRTGRVYLSPGVEIEQDDGEASMTPDIERWTEALAVVRQYRGRALAIADDRIVDLAGDIAGQARWRAIRSRIEQIMEAAARDAWQ